MNHFFTKLLFLVFILVVYTAEAHHHHGHGSSHTDTLVRGTRSRPNGERSLRESMVLCSEKHLKIKGFGDYERDSASEDTDIKVVLRVAEGGTLFIGSEEDSIPGEFRITDNTLLIIEDGARLQIEEGSSLIVESGGGIIIKAGADLAVLGEQAVILKPDAQACIRPFDSIVVVIPPKGQGDIILIDDCKPIDDPNDPPIIDPRDSITGPIYPPWDPTDPGNWPSNVDSTYTNNLQGMVSTTPSGALIYQIPILVPVGTAGMQPQLAIVYNSQNNASGILGAGFGLSGLSSISRVGKNFYHDGERTGVTLTTNDHFALDGQRLIRTAGSGPIGSDGNIFDTEITSFVDIQAYGSSSHEGPQRFQVRTKDGSILEYGDSTYSRSEFTRSTYKVANEWHIRAQSDPNGNYILYEYDKTGEYDKPGEYVHIKRIRYTGNYQTGLQPYNEIEFKYKNKPVQRKLFIAGFEIIEGKLLDTIICYSNNEVVKRYAFEYTADKKQLLYMRELDPSGRILGELAFEWKKMPTYNFEDAKRWTSEFGSGWTYNNHLRMLADVTGNGKADVIGFGNNFVNVGKSLTQSFSNPEPWYNGYTINSGGWQVEDHPRYIVDVNGDGLADIVGFSGSNGVEVSLSNGVNGFSPAEVWSSDFKSTTGSAKTYPRYLADFNGDGLPDIIAICSDSIRVALNTITGFSKYFSIPNGRKYNFSLPITDVVGYVVGDESDIALVGDITGDGRADVVLLKRGEMYLNNHTITRKFYEIFYAISNGDSFKELYSFYNYGFFARPFSVSESSVFGIDPNCHFNCFLQDVNGDGKADLVFTGRDGLYVALSTGTGFEWPVRWTNHYGSTTKYCDPKYQLMMADMNGDGLADLVAFDSEYVYVSLSTGGGFANPVRWTSNNFWGPDVFYDNNTSIYTSPWVGPKGIPCKNSFRTLADVNGDGLPDLVGFVSSGLQHFYPFGTYVSLNQSGGYAQLIAVRDNLGKQFDAVYSTLTDSTVYKKGTGAINGTQEKTKFPLMNFQGPLSVCKSLRTRTNDKTYFYEDAVIDHQGRGFLGFSKTTETDTRLQLKQVSWFFLSIAEGFADFPTLIFRHPYNTQIYSTVNNFLLSETNLSYNILPLGDWKKQYTWHSVTGNSSKDFLTGIEHITNFVYGNTIIEDRGGIPTYAYADGNVTYTKTTIQPIGTSSYGGEPLSISETSNSYTTVLSRRYPNRLLTTETHSYYAVSPNNKISHKQHFTYDHKGNLTKSVDRPGTLDAVTTDYTLHPQYGLVQGITTSTIGIPSMSKTFGYDSLFRSPISQTTPLGTSSKAYNIWGQVLSDTAIGGQTTTYEYDEFGRLAKVISPEGYETTYKIFRERKPAGTVYVSLVEQEGRPYVKSYLDILGRTIMTESPTPGGIVITEAKYNDKGQLNRNSVPRFVDEPVNWTTYTYDFVGRLHAETLFGQKTDYAYIGLESWVRSPSEQISIKAHNHTGDLVSVKDAAGGEVHYTYYAPGYVETIEAPGGAVTTITYDGYGRQKSITDPNAGTIRYEYNAFDQIIEKTDTNENVTTYEYDEHGRLEQVVETDKYGNERITTYAYISSGRNIGRLRSISCDNGTSQTYTYNRFGRIRYRVDTILQKSFVTEYDYDEYGNLKTYKYPSGYTLTYLYDTNGYQKEIRVGTRSVWKLDSVNAMGQELGSTVLGRTKTQTYNDFGQPVQMYLKDLMDYTYEYNASTGNMTYRYNPYNKQEEFFDYDKLDRLISGVSYHSNGNISDKYNVGNYVYNHPDKVHAVTGVDYTLLSGHEHDITYTSFGKIETVKRIDEYGDEALPQMSFVYGPTHERLQVTLYITDNKILKRYYLPNCEITEIVDAENELISRHIKEYIYSPYGLVAIHYGSDFEPEEVQGSYEGINPTNWELIGDLIKPPKPGYLHPVATDHLGSIVAEFNPRKFEYEFFGYDAWGRRYLSIKHTPRDPLDGFEAPPIYYSYFDEYLPCSDEPENWLDHFTRGYTGHEHMDMFGLINMNGRMYDPVLGRMLSPDPYVPNATYTQDFNRYTYARNNPLSYIDPDGELIFPAMFLAGIINLGVNEQKVDNFWQGLGYFTVGALVGAGGALAAGIMPMGIIKGGITGAIAGGAGSYLLNGGNNLIAGNNFNDGAGKAITIGAISAGIAGGIQGYNSASAAGRNLWWGSEIKDGRNQWSFFTSEKPYETVKFNIREGIGSRRTHDCVPTTLAEANDFFGGDISYDKWRGLSGYQDGVGVETTVKNINSLVTDNFSTGEFHSGSLRDPAMMRQIQQNGNLITVDRPIGTPKVTSMRHLDNIRSIRYYRSGNVLIRDRYGSFYFAPTDVDYKNLFFFRLLGIK